jgi:pimeloyl-ACP methyl ester carboxylesterase
MGLVVKERGKPIRISNAIYREIIPRELTASTQQQLTQNPLWYQNPDNSINMEKLLLDFQQFFRQNADSWIQKFDYAEAGPQLLLQAYLQRIVNGGGYIDREYGLGRRRTDLLIRKPLTDHYGGPIQRIVLELKIKRNSIEKTIEDGLRQTWEYMDKAGAVDEGHFIIFDRTPGTEPAVQMANQLGMVFAKLDCTPRWRERLPELAIPALVVHGRRDRFFPVGNGEALASQIPGARLLVLEHAATAIPAAAAGEIAAAMLEL